MEAWEGEDEGTVREGEDPTTGREPKTEGMGEGFVSDTPSLGVSSLSVACMVRRG